MKKIITIMLALSAFSAFAGEIKLFDRPTFLMSTIIDVRGEFAINANLGRAWVNFVFTDDGYGPVAYDERVKVEGLSYNSTTNQIILDAEGTQTVCANVKINFFGTHIKNTGKCTFKKEYHSVKVDNGYEVESVRKLKISLVY